MDSDEMSFDDTTHHGLSSYRFIKRLRTCLSTLCGFGLTAIVVCGAGCGGPNNASPVAKEGVSGGAAAAPPAAQPSGPAPQTPESKAEAAFLQLVAAAGENGAPEDWATAERELNELGKDAVPALARGLKSEEKAVREFASMLLASLGPDAMSGEAALRAALTDPSHFVRVNAASTLASFGNDPKAVVPVLVDLLTSGEKNIRQTAAASLSHAGTEAATVVPALMIALDDAEADIRAAAATSLGRLGPAAEASISRLEQLAAEPAPVGPAALGAVDALKKPATTEADRAIAPE